MRVRVRVGFIKPAYPCKYPHVLPSSSSSSPSPDDDDSAITAIARLSRCRHCHTAFARVVAVALPSSCRRLRDRRVPLSHPPSSSSRSPLSRPHSSSSPSPRPLCRPRPRRLAPPSRLVPPDSDDDVTTAIARLSRRHSRRRHLRLLSRPHLPPRLATTNVVPTGIPAHSEDIYIQYSMYLCVRTP